METAWPILLFLAFLFGSCLLILVCAVGGKAEEASTLAVLEQEALRVPRFFAPLETGSAPSPLSAVDDSLVDRVERHLRSERQAAGRFVSEPTVRSLYDPAGQAALHDASPIERVERYLRRELALAACFVSDPSIHSLYGRFAPQGGVQAP